jgi:hypothetical protein
MISSVTYTLAPAFHFWMAVQHTYAMGTMLALLSPLWLLFLGPGPTLVVVASRHKAGPQVVWPLVVCAVMMAAWAIGACWSFGRQGDVHWALWTVWALAGGAAGVALIGAFALRAGAQQVAITGDMSTR